MTQYNMYKIKIKLLSALATPLMADTIWGHICYGILFYEGENKLKEFLETNKMTDKTFNPPLILSTPFPQDMIPIPKMQYKYEEEEMDLEKYKKLKERKKIKYININELVSKDKKDGKKRLVEVIEKELERKDGKEKFEMKIENRMRNSINRILGTTSENSIFQIEEYWFSHAKEINNIKYFNDVIFDIYVLSLYDKERTKNLFDMGFSLGYGADSSTGKGKIEVDKIEDFSFPSEGNIGVALSPFVPTEKEYEMFEKDGTFYADIWTKYPKVHNSNPKMTNPFKKPIIFYKEGSTFIINENSNLNEKPLFVGQCVNNIHHIPEIMQYAIAPIFWLNLE